MPDFTDDLSKVRHVKRGDSVSERITSQPTRALELRLGTLEQIVSSLTQIGEFGRHVIRNVPIKTGDQAVVMDDVVYFNANTGLYEKALAGVTFEAGSYNSNSSSLVVGVCLATKGSIGDIMVSGYEKWRDANHRINMLESTETYVPGIPYFLSDDEPGKLTRFPPALRIQVFTGTDSHYILQPVFSSPEAHELLHRVPVGMRPVGGTRHLPPEYSHQVIVGFDGLELHEPAGAHSRWRTTRQSEVPALEHFGYMAADAEITAEPTLPVYVRVITGTNGLITVLSGNQLEDLHEGGDVFNVITGLSPLTPGTQGFVRSYSLQASATDTTQIGTLWFKYISDDLSLRRDVIFKVPDSFQGWKMINAPIAPMAQAVVTNGQLAGTNILERGIGFLTPPKLIITGTGDITTTAQAQAVLDEFGSIVQIQITEPGAGYITAEIEFDIAVDQVIVAQGGHGAVLQATQTDGEITEIQVINGGSGFLSDVSIVISDVAGQGAVAQAKIQNGTIVGVEIVSQGSDYVNPRAYARPSGVYGYRETRQGVFQAVLTGDQVTDVIILADADTGVFGGRGYPIRPKVTFSGGNPASEASAEAVVDPENGEITGFTILDQGSGYESVPEVLVGSMTPALVFSGGNPDVSAAGILHCATSGLSKIHVEFGGFGYSPTSTVTCVGGLLPGGAAALVQLVVSGSGRILRGNILNPGSGYFEPPQLVITDPGGLGNGASIQAVIDTWPTVAEVNDSGSGYKSTPQVAPGVPLRRIEVETAGSGYFVPPVITVEPPDLDPSLGGVTAEAVARLGGTIRRVRIEAAGTGYTAPVTVSVAGGGGSGAKILAAVDPDGSLASLDVVDGGYGFTSAPTLTVSGGPGFGAVLVAELEATDGSVVRIDMVDQGFGYTRRPIVMIPAPPSGVAALGQAKLQGEGTSIGVRMHGDGGIHFRQTAALAEGNHLQIRDYGDDLGEGLGADYVKPAGVVFYYNIKADPTLKGRWPAVPVGKALFTLNGVELESTEFSETTGLLHSPKADVLFTMKTPMWTTLDADGCPWDREHMQYVLDPEAYGKDSRIHGTGADGHPDTWWQYWDHVYKYEPNRNAGQLHINRSSRFHQVGRVGSLGALAPLRLIDVTTGTEARDDGTLMTGQLLMVLDNQVNFLSGTGAQINARLSNNLVPIYHNGTGRPVFISSVLLQVVYQLNALATPSVSDSARITVGTQAGNYRDIVGTVDPTQVGQQGRLTRLYKINHMKELFPDDRESSPIILPGQVVFLRVDYPVNSAAIQAQTLVAKLKGHVL
jgi:hypothetical protein